MPIQFFFSAMSPYSWLAAERIHALIPVAEWKPVFGAGVQEANGRISWGLTDRRETEMATCEARARSYGLGEVRWPDPWPHNGALVARGLVYAQRRGELERFALTAMRMAFLEAFDLGEVESLRAVASRVGFSPEDLAAALDDPDIDAAMRACCDEAVALGVFGIPTVLIDDDDALFWGDDRLEEAAAYAASVPSTSALTEPEAPAS